MAVTPTGARVPFESETGDQHAVQSRNSKSYATISAFVLGMMVATIALLSIQHYGLGDESFTKFFFAPAVPHVQPSKGATGTSGALAGAQILPSRSKQMFMKATPSNVEGAPTRRDVLNAAALSGLSLVPAPAFADEGFSNMGGLLTPVVETSKGFKLYVPSGWNMFGTAPGEYDAKWQDIVESESTIIVSSSPVEKATSVDAIGDLDTVAEKFAKSRNAQVVKATSRDVGGSLVYVLDLKGETMHELLALTINRNKFFRVSATTSNKRWGKREELYKNVINSFVPKGV